MTARNDAKQRSPMAKLLFVGGAILTLEAAIFYGIWGELNNIRSVREYQLVEDHEHNKTTLSLQRCMAKAVLNHTLQGYVRGRVVHTAKEYVRGDVHTNGIEAFWSQLKKSIKGTHTFVSPQHLQSYLDAAVFRWNNRSDVFAALMERI